MIANHQPTSFDSEKLVVAVSSRDDGNQSFRVQGADPSDTDDVIRHNRLVLCERNGIDSDSCAFVYVQYGDERDYETYRVVEDADIGPGMFEPGTARVADGLATDRPGVGLFLPLADCNGAILHDPNLGRLMVTHLGRHSTMIDGAKKSVEFMKKSFGSEPADLKVWLSPSAGKDSYSVRLVPEPGHYNFADDPKWKDFSYVKSDKVFLDLTGYNRGGFLNAGVLPENIDVSLIDTATSNEYPSHSDGDAWRFAIVAMMKHAA